MIGSSPSMSHLHSSKPSRALESDAATRPPTVSGFIQTVLTAPMFAAAIGVIHV